MVTVILAGCGVARDDAEEALQKAGLELVETELLPSLTDPEAEAETMLGTAPERATTTSPGIGFAGDPVYIAVLRMCCVGDISDGEPQGSQYIKLMDSVFASGVHDWVAQELRDWGEVVRLTRTLRSADFDAEREIAGWLAQLRYVPQEEHLLHITLHRCGLSWRC